MPPFCGLDFISGHIAVFLVLQATLALKLDIPSDVVLGETIQVSWTSAADDPDTINLFLSCDGGHYQMIASTVSTASASFPVTMPALNSSNSPTLLSCDIQARRTDGVTVLDGFVIDVAATPVTTSSDSTWSSSESLPAMTVPQNVFLSSASSPVTSSSLESTQTPALLVTITLAVVSFSSPPSQQLPTETSTSRPAQSSSSSTDTITTSITSTSSTIIALQSTNSLTQAPTKPIGTIIGAIISGLLGLLILALLMLFLCRRRYRRRPWYHRSRFMCDVKANLSSVPIFKAKEEALLGNDEETPYDTSKSSPSDAQHSGYSPHSHYHLNDDESPYDLDIRLQPMRFSESSSSILVPVLRTADVKEEGRETQHTDYRHSPYLESSKSLTREGGVYHEARNSWTLSPRPTGYDRISQSLDGSFDIDKMDPEVREQRRDALLERMRRVLDGEQIV